MKAGRASQTAVLVCMGRALGHARARAELFSDPTALALLPDDARAEVERMLAGAPPPPGFRARFRAERLRVLERVMVARTARIDGALREARAPQVVILGAGLDGRAWRMPELADATVFDVDHPDSQREKRAQVERARLVPSARDVRFVPVDFTRDALDTALARAGHDAAAPTAWIWEGVVMYLTPAQVESSLEVIAARSAPRSVLAVAYHSPALILAFIGLLLRRLGEPLRSSFTAEEMGALLARHGFRVTSDEDVLGIARAMGLEAGERAGYGAHIRIAVATRS